MESLRSEIERLDSEIIELVAQRRDVSREIGLVKKKERKPVRDESREAVVLSEFAAQAGSLGVDAKLASKLARALIDDSIRIQKGRASKFLSGKTALVVGGSGKMGEWTCRFLSDRGAAVAVWDPRGGLRGYRTVRSVRGEASDADMVVIASPLGACPAELGDVLEASPEGLVFDLCSVKSHIAKQLRTAAKAGTRITSVHPMFGPSAASPRGRNVLVCDCGCRDADDEAAKLFSSAGAQVSRLPLERHDEMMAYVLGLSHLCALLFGSALQRSGEPVKEFTVIQGPSFRKMSRLARELSRESKRVYHDIQALNPHTRHLIASMEEVLRDLRRAALDGDSARFGALMESNREYLEVR